MKKLNLKGITSEAVIGVLVLVLALANAVLTMFQIKVLPITNDDINTVISGLFVIVTALYNTYKNRNISTAAQIAQEVTDTIKKGEILTADVEEIIARLKESDAK